MSDDAAAAIGRIVVAAQRPAGAAPDAEWTESVVSALVTSSLPELQVVAGVIDAAAQLALLLGQREADVPLVSFSVDLVAEEWEDANTLIARDLVVAAMNDVLAVDHEAAKQRVAGLSDSARLLGWGFIVAAQIAGELYDRCLTQDVTLPPWLQAAGEA